VGDGGIRVAFWKGNDGHSGEIIIERDRVDLWRAADGIKSTRGVLLKDRRAQLLCWLRSQQELPSDWVKIKDDLSDRDTAAKFSSAKFAMLMLNWRKNRLPNDDSIFKIMEGQIKALSPEAEVAIEANRLALRTTRRSRHRAGMKMYDGGRRQDKHLYQYQIGRQRYCQNYRKIKYREAAIELSKLYKDVILADIDWAEIAKNPEIEDADRHVNKTYRALAAGGKLKDDLKCLMNWVEVSAAGITVTCSKCGRTCPDPGPSKWVCCEPCGGEKVDRALNAANNMLYRDLEVMDRKGAARKKKSFVRKVVRNKPSLKKGD
jgi:hypothetical protein